MFILIGNGLFPLEAINFLFSVDEFPEGSKTINRFVSLEIYRFSLDTHVPLYETLINKSNKFNTH